MATVIIDFNRARTQKQARQSRPFQGKLLRAAAAQINPHTRAVMARAVADGFAQGRTTQYIIASLRKAVQA